jgi:hypothetical protein
MIDNVSGKRYKEGNINGHPIALPDMKIDSKGMGRSSWGASVRRVFAIRNVKGCWPEQVC